MHLITLKMSFSQLQLGHKPDILMMLGNNRPKEVAFSGVAIHP